MTGPDFAAFDEQLDELALGDIAEPARSRLLAHVATCSSCRQRLDELLALTDSLLELAPQHEPPPGFESRVLDRLVAASRPAAPSVPRRTWHRRTLALLAAAAIVLAAFGGVLWGRRGADDPVSVVRSGTIIGSDGSRVGDVQLVRADQPYVVVTIDHPRPGNRVVSCELEFADGRTVIAGSWDYEDVKSNVWAVGIDPSALDAVTMRIVSDDGTVRATATLD